MNEPFLICGEKSYSYEGLLRDVAVRDRYAPVLRVPGNEPYEIFLSVVHSLVHGYPLELVDGDFSDFELKDLGIDPRDAKERIPVKSVPELFSFEEIISVIRSNSDWKLSLYTSGTAGRPKRVTHTFESLTRNVKTDERFKDNVWAFAYNPTHMAGLQVFFQAFLNRNKVVYAFDGYRRLLPELLANQGVTHISATSTYYRNVLPDLRREGRYELVRSAAFGGEKFDVSLEQALHETFPNARIRNIYASTEAGSLFAAKGEEFEIPESISQLVRFGENREMWLHASLLGQSDSFSLDEGWFNTGDIVEPAGELKFRFVSRRSDWINVGGYKVNPLEVEAVLGGLPGVADLVVKGKANSVTGHILVADVVKEEGYDAMELKKAIKAAASEALQEWKIPRVINFVEDVPKTRTGKKARA